MWAEKEEDRYTFRHAMFQDAAYHSLLRKTRQLYHLQIAELLQQDNPGISQQHPELVAYHYSRTEHLDVAVDLWLKAGEHAITQAAVKESLQHLYQGLKLVRKLPENRKRNQSELALLLNLGIALTARSGYHGSEVTNAYERALVLAETAGNDQQAWAALYGLWRCRVSQAEFAKSVRVSVKLKSLGEKSRDPRSMMTAYGLQGMIRMVTGKFVSAEHFYDMSVVLYDQSRDKHMGVRFGQDPYVTIKGLGAVNKLVLNKIPASIMEITRSLEVARTIAHPYTVAETLRVAAMYQQIAGDLEQLEALANETVTLAETFGFEGLLAAGNIFQGFCYVMRRGKADKVKLIQRNLEFYAEKYGKLFLPYFHGLLAAACLALEDYSAAKHVAEQALEMVDQFGEEWSRAPLLGIKAEAAARGGLASVSEIDQWFRCGIETAAVQQAELVLERLLISASRCGHEPIDRVKHLQLLSRPGAKFNKEMSSPRVKNTMEQDVL